MPTKIMLKFFFRPAHTFDVLLNLGIQSLSNNMSTDKIIIKDITPISTVHQFTDILSQMAVEFVPDTDPLTHFAPKIEMMERFALGIYQWCIVDFATQQLLAVGGQVEEMTGKKPGYWLGTTADKYVTELAP